MYIIYISNITYYNIKNIKYDIILKLKSYKYLNFIKNIKLNLYLKLLIYYRI